MAAYAPAPLLSGTVSSVSANWAGYVADSASSYTAVGATWTVPVPSATSQEREATDATWVGIGGVKTNDLIQSGTQAIIENGTAAYQAWYELLPDYQDIVPLNVSGGDSVTVKITEIGTDLWHISFVDNTTGGDYEKNVAYHSALSSAEWIEEMPVMDAGRFESYMPLDNFGTLTFTNGYTVANGTKESIAASGAQSLTMAAGRRSILAAPSALSDDSFSVTRQSGTAESALPTGTVVYAIGSGTNPAAAKTGSSGSARSPHRGRWSTSLTSGTPTVTSSNDGSTIVITFGWGN